MLRLSIRMTHRIMAIGAIVLLGLLAVVSIYEVGRRSQEISRSTAEAARSWPVRATSSRTTGTPLPQIRAARVTATQIDLLQAQRQLVTNGRAHAHAGGADCLMQTPALHGGRERPRQRQAGLA